MAGTLAGGAGVWQINKINLSHSLSAYRKFHLAAPDWPLMYIVLHCISMLQLLLPILPRCSLNYLI